MSDAICKGDFRLGTACGECERCKAQMEIYIREYKIALTAPVKGGIQFWEINDLKNMYALVSISIHFPNAKQTAMMLFAQWLRETK